MLKFSRGHFIGVGVALVCAYTPFISVTQSTVRFLKHAVVKLY